MISPLSVYIHIPFCLSKCPYCDFFSVQRDASGVNPSEYFRWLELEVELLCRRIKGLEGRTIASLYFGGGTPSLFAPAMYGGLIARLTAAFVFAPNLEGTLEINPGTLGGNESNGKHSCPSSSTDPPVVALPDSNRLESFLKMGINRLSVGVQSFSDRTLERLGRAHRTAETLVLLEWIRARAAKAAGNLTWCMDLIFGAPGQSLADWQGDLQRALAWQPHHLSVYGLTVHKGTPFAHLQREGRLDLPDEETQRAMFLEARHTLTAAGYEHYEISNYARPGFRSRHNECYWTGGEYLGLGPSAHSFVAGVRWANPPNLLRYGETLEAGRLPRRFDRAPKGRARLGEQVMLGLRRLEGIDLEAFRARIGCDLTQAYGREIARLAEAGFLELAHGRLRLTEEGLLVADAVMTEFF
ncbi:MAG: coproporphyrinogen III oxidase family protein [Candidatus Sumerlaeia bacterium]|nr:coproporphyrinogen III oxidase family protein [Candidatus Sumerlaeia bacterium]